MAQTTIQQEKAIRKGSVRIQVGDSFDSLVDIGAIRDPILTLMVEPQSIEFDNVEDIRQFAEGDKVQMAFTLTEINLTNLAKFDKGMVNFETIDGSPVDVENETKTLAPDIPVRLNNKNGDNTRVANIVVEGRTEGVDYEVFVDADGYTNLIRIGDSSINVSVDYTYTPAVSKRITFVKQGTKQKIVCRVVNKDSDNKEFRIDMERVTNIQAPAIDFAGDDEAEVATLPIILEGYIKEIVDSQQTI